MASFLPISSVEASNYAVYPVTTIGLSLSIVEGGDATGSLYNNVALTLSITTVFESVTLYEAVGLNLLIGTGDDAGLKLEMPVQTLGLTFNLGTGSPYNLIVVWEPYDTPLFTGKNYTYIVHLGLSGSDVVADITVRFEGSKVTEKTTNATGFMEYWAIVGSPGVHTWSFTIYELGSENAIIYKDIEYIREGGEDPDTDPDPGPGPIIPDLPTEPGALFGVLDYLPAMVVFGFFGFGGMLMMGRLGLMFGAVGALFVLTAMGTLPTWILYFAILIAILVVVFKLKSGGSNVTVEGGNA